MAVVAASRGPRLGAASSDARLMRHADARTLADFRMLSARLTGFAAGDLDAELAAALWRSLVVAGHGDELTRLLSAAGASQSALAAQIVSAWYSGVHPGADGPVAATFNEALMWPALGFAAPRGVCARPGSWAERPEN